MSSKQRRKTVVSKYAALPACREPIVPLRSSIQRVQTDSALQTVVRQFLHPIALASTVNVVDFGRRRGLCLAATPNWNDMFKRLYGWLIALSQSASAPYALAAVAFAESSFFPIPPDVILAPMSLAKPRLAWRYALIATCASVLGGVLGYAIGALLYDTLGRWLIGIYGYGDRVAALRQAYATWGALVILIKGLTPIPFKLVTIVSGLLGYNFGLFVALSVLTRGARFFLLAAALNHFGDPLQVALERHFAAFLGILAAIIVIGFVIAAKVF
jgi:membrane protein YqaA with SNARE-associated domain